MRRVGILVAGLSAAMIGIAGAQQRPIELGLDAGLGITTTDPSVVTISFPIQSFRVGFFVSDQLSLEPQVAWNLLKVSDADAVYTLGAELGLLYHFSADQDRSRLHVRPLAGVSLFGGGGDTASQFSAGGALGVKFPVRNRLGLRLEGGVRYGFESDEFSSATTIFAAFGFSFMAR